NSPAGQQSSQHREEKGQECEEEPSSRATHHRDVTLRPFPGHPQVIDVGTQSKHDGAEYNESERCPPRQGDRALATRRAAVIPQALDLLILLARGGKADAIPVHSGDGDFEPVLSLVACPNSPDRIPREGSNAEGAAVGNRVTE